MRTSFLRIFPCSPQRRGNHSGALQFAWPPNSAPTESRADKKCDAPRQRIQPKEYERQGFPPGAARYTDWPRPRGSIRGARPECWEGDARFAVTLTYLPLRPLHYGCRHVSTKRESSKSSTGVVVTITRRISSISKKKRALRAAILNVRRFPQPADFGLVRAMRPHLAAGNVR